MPTLSDEHSHFDRSGVPSKFKSFVSKATKFEYKCWLAGYLKNGGEVHHVRSYDYKEGHYYVANFDFEVPELYGANAFDIIVPRGVEVDSSNCGRCKVMRMDGFKTNDTVEVFSNLDIPFEKLAEL